MKNNTPFHQASNTLTETRQAILIQLLKGQRGTGDPESMMTEAVEAMGHHLKTNRVGFFTMVSDHTLEFGALWADAVLDALRGQWPATNLGVHCLAEMRAGRTVAVGDTACDPMTTGSRLAEIGARAIIATPITRNGKLCAGLYVHHAIAREWTAGEIEFVREIADITWDAVERSQATMAMGESEKLFREIADVTPVLIWMSDKTKACTWFNKPWLDFTGRTMPQELGYGWSQGVHPDDFDRCVATYSDAFDRREPFRMDYRLRRYDGLWRIVNDIGVPRFSSDGTFLGYIGSCLDVTEKRTTEQSLRESEERFRGVFERAATGIVIRDRDERFVCCNPAFSMMVGYSEEELRQLAFATYVHPEDKDENLAACKRLATGEISSYEIVNRYVRKDGKPIWVHKYVSFLKDAAGRDTNILVLVTDVTSHKQQEDQIRLLMREVNHRSKNMLSLVQAIARQTLAANPEDFVERFGKRVEALAANQDLLVKNSWKGACLNELTRSQLSTFDDLIDTRIGLQGPALFVSAPATQVIGMALHELATNASKYGALSNADGRVDITWCIEGGSANDEKTFIMTWREHCVSPITPPVKRGFGSSVISTMAEMSLGAQIELDYLSRGLTWQLSCAAGEVLEGGVRCVPVTESEANSITGAELASHRPRVLVVEDEALVAVEIAHVITEAGFDVIGPARSVLAALELLKRSGCDAAVLDINLGRETSEAIAIELTVRKTPFVTLSGYSSEQHHPVFAGAPALTKPLRLQFLIAELKKFLDQKRGEPVQRAEVAAS